MIQQRKHKQFYQLNFLSLYYNPVSLLPLSLSNRIIMDEILFNFIHSNAILSSLFFKGTIENNLFQIHLTRSTNIKNRKRLKNRKKNVKKSLIHRNKSILNAKEWINLLNRTFIYINTKKPNFDLYIVGSIILEPSLIASWTQFQLLKNRVKILFLIRKITKTFSLILKKKNWALNKKVLSFNLDLNTILLIILVLIITKAKKWTITPLYPKFFNIAIDFKYSILNFKEINYKLIRFYKTKKAFKKTKRAKSLKKVIWKRPKPLNVKEDIKKRLNSLYKEHLFKRFKRNLNKKLKKARRRTNRLLKLERKRNKRYQFFMSRSMTTSNFNNNNHYKTYYFRPFIIALLIYFI